MLQRMGAVQTRFRHGIPQDPRVMVEVMGMSSQGYPLD